MTKKPLRVGLFGGTFDPVHRGHIAAALHFYDEAALDVLYIVPDRIPPHKADRAAPAGHRLEMTRLAFSPETVEGRNVVVSDRELRREGKSYTADTVDELMREHAGCLLFLYAGSDMFYTLETWHRGEELLKTCSVVTTARKDGEQEKLQTYAARYKDTYGTECLVMRDPPVEVSSTQIRAALRTVTRGKETKFTKNLLTESVTRYIMENHLYERK